MSQPAAPTRPTDLLSALAQERVGERTVSRSQLAAENRRSDFDARIDRLNRTIRRANSGSAKSPPSRSTSRPSRPRFSSGSARLPAN